MALDDERSRAAVASWIRQQYDVLTRSSYYQILGVPRDAPVPAVRDAYYRLVARMHPDLFAGTLDEETHRVLIRVYSWLVEGYQVLCDGARRQQYDRMLAHGKLRWSQDDERAASTRRDPETEIANPHARRLFKLARASLGDGDTRSAIMNLKMALSVEPRSPVLLEELARAEAMHKEKGR